MSDKENDQKQKDGTTAKEEQKTNLEQKQDKKQKKEKATEQETIKYGNTHLLQVAVVLLAVVSFFTTANGMSQYIFSGNMGIAYAASAAIQGILLSLSMNLPDYVHGIWTQKWNWLIRLLLCIAAFCLTGVAVFCSSWFSYIYIAEVIHQDSWGTDSELLVQQAYRSELYDAQEYARAYRIYLENAVGEKILLIEEQATHLQDNMVDFGLNWDAGAILYHFWYHSGLHSCSAVDRGIPGEISSGRSGL